MAGRKIRYAVVGLGHIAQNAVLPAFEHAKENSELVGFVSDSTEKIEELSKIYGVTQHWRYEEYEQCVKSGKIDAVYIALPNDMHREYTVKALDAGVNVLCEKPMAPSAEDCRAMIDAAKRNNKKLMIAYRLHFEEGNIAAIEAIASGKIGEPRYFTSSFSQQVTDGNIRTQGEHQGGALYDIGVYCINATRYLFRDEPVSLSAVTASRNDKRFAEVDEMVASTLEFPKARIATFVASQGAASTGWYEVAGTEGSLRLEEGYGYQSGHKLIIKGLDGKEIISEREFEKRDHFGPELLYFANCILNNTEPEPNGFEGMLDIQIIEAIQEAAKKGRKVELDLQRKQTRPSMEQEILMPPVSPPTLVDVQPPSSK